MKKLPVVDKKSGISMRFCCSLFYNNLLFTGMHYYHKSLIQSVKLSQVEKLRKNIVVPSLWQDFSTEWLPESAWKASHSWKTIQLPPLWQDFCTEWRTECVWKASHWWKTIQVPPLWRFCWAIFHHIEDTNKEEALTLSAIQHLKIIIAYLILLLLKW